MNNNLDDIQITYIGGGSRNWAWTFMSDLSKEEEICGTIRLYDIDEEAANANMIIGNRLSSKETTKGKWTYVVSHSLEEALDKTNFVVISILPGTFEHMRSDVHSPEKYGIYQSVGDTTGIGGYFRALRTLPMFVAIAESIKQYAPDAWVINYTNPMSMCVRTLYQVFPKIKAIGCCHEVFGTQNLLVKALKDICNIDGVNRTDIVAEITGINHFTWFTKASYKNIDLFDVFREFSDQYYDSGYIDQDNMTWETDTFKFCERIKFDLFRRYHAIAAAGDRHLAEFLPSLYLSSPEKVKKWKYGLTTVDWRIQNRLERIEQSRKYVSGEDEFEMMDLGEEGVLIIKSLLGLNRFVTNVNLPNSGQISNLPNDVIVETNAVISRDHIAPVISGSLPEPLYQIIYPHVELQEKTVTVGMSGNKDEARQEFFDVVRNYELTAENRETLFEEMYKNSMIL